MIVALHRTGLVLASLALLFGVAACGGGDDATPANGGGPGGPGGEGMNAYVECLRKNGVTITMPSAGPGVGGLGGRRPSGAPGGPGGERPSGQPGPSGGPRGGGGFMGGGKPAGVDDATWEKAQQACASVRPSFGAGNGRGGRGEGSPAYRNCLAENGVTLGEGASAAPDQAALEKAREACKALAPTPQPSS